MNMNDDEKYENNVGAFEDDRKYDDSYDDNYEFADYAQIGEKMSMGMALLVVFVISAVLVTFTYTLIRIGLNGNTDEWFNRMKEIQSYGDGVLVTEMQGRWIGDIWQNDKMDIRYKLMDGWKPYSDEELNEIADDEYSSSLRVMGIEKTNGDFLEIVAFDLSYYPEYDTTEKVLEKVEEDFFDNYEEYGYSLAITDNTEVSICGKTFLTNRVALSNEGKNACVFEIMVNMIGEYNAIAILSGVNPEGNVEEAIAGFMK